MFLNHRDLLLVVHFFLDSESGVKIVIYI